MADFLLVKKGEYLFRQGDESEGMYIVRNGEFSIMTEENGVEKEVFVATPGHLIGELGLFDKQNRIASVRAKVNSSVVSLPYTQLERQLKHLPPWVPILMRTLTEKLKDVNKAL